jgi:hypothetical protein
MFLIQSSPDEVKSYEDFGRLMQDPERTGMAEYRAASEGYFETMGIPLVRGRLFEASDDAEAPHVALVRQGLVRKMAGRIPSESSSSSATWTETCASACGQNRRRRASRRSRCALEATIYQRASAPVGLLRS